MNLIPLSHRYKQDARRGILSHQEVFALYAKDGWRDGSEREDWHDFLSRSGLVQCEQSRDYGLLGEHITSEPLLGDVYLKNDIDVHIDYAAEFIGWKVMVRYDALVEGRVIYRVERGSKDRWMEFSRSGVLDMSAAERCWNYVFRKYIAHRQASRV